MIQGFHLASSRTIFNISLATSWGAGEIRASRASPTSCFGSTEEGYLAAELILRLESESTFRRVRFSIFDCVLR